jgi:hypothetical protein
MASNPECRYASERLGAMAARLTEPLPALRFTKLDKVFTYGIVAMWGSQFAHHGMAVDGGGGW